MTQFACHVSTGMSLWEHRVHPGTVLYLALEDDYQRLQNRMFCVEGTDKLHFAVDVLVLENELKNRIK